ncbi:MAG: type II toxin-antitoxin system mRNA interferase toxin, RelE/StbE family [Patescibacteria group bacterium]
MIVNFHGDFKKDLKKLSKNQQVQFFKRLDTFLKNPTHIVLNNHKLSGKLKNMRSINITGNIRVIYEEVDRNTVLFLMIGNHGKLYG